MSLEIKTLEENIKEKRVLGPGSIVPGVEIPGGGIVDIIGGVDKFYVRRPNAQGPDTEYTYLRINYPDGRIMVFQAERPQNWEAHPILDAVE